MGWSRICIYSTGLQVLASRNYGIAQISKVKFYQVKCQRGRKYGEPVNQPKRKYGEPVNQLGRKYGEAFNQQGRKYGEAFNQQGRKYGEAVNRRPAYHTFKLLSYTVFPRAGSMCTHQITVQKGRHF